MDIPGPIVTIPFIVALIAKIISDLIGNRRKNKKLDEIQKNVTPSNGTPTAQIVEKLSEQVGDLTDRVTTLAENQTEMLEIMAKHIPQPWDGTERRKTERSIPASGPVRPTDR